MRVRSRGAACLLASLVALAAWGAPELPVVSVNYDGEIGRAHV
jgi:hypothetical protein